MSILFAILLFSFLIFIHEPTLEDILETDRLARQAVRSK